MKTTSTITLALFASITLLAACDDGTEIEDAQLVLEDEPELTWAGEIPLEELSDEELGQLQPTDGGEASTTSGITYQCSIDVNASFTSCNPALVDANEAAPGEWVADVFMGNPEANFRRMDIYAKVCKPTGYALHVSDSPTANGWGGDASTTDHDAEAHSFGSSLQFYSTSDFANGAFGNHSSLGNAFGPGCQIVHSIAYHDNGSNVGVFAFTGGGSPLAIRDTQGMKLDYEPCAGGASDPLRGTQCDFEDDALDYMRTWHFGLNRTVGSSSRDGTGVQEACVVLNEDVSVTPPNCLESGDGPANPVDPTTPEEPALPDEPSLPSEPSLPGEPLTL